MSFDLFLVERPGPGETWDDVLERMAEATDDQTGPAASDRALWEVITEAVVAVLPNATVADADGWRQVTDGSAVFLNMLPGEITINTPYGLDEGQAADAVDRLLAVAQAIEDATDLVAYDPQADSAFLDGGAAAAPATFGQIRDFMTNELGAEPVTRPRRPWWARWRRRHR